MPKKQRANYFNFSGGLDTDSSILNRNPITVTDIDNCVLNTDGSISSRGGIEAGTLESPTVSSYITYAPTSKVYEWRFKDDLGADIAIQVLRTGSIVSFYIGDEPIGTPQLTVDTNTNPRTHVDIVFDGNIAYVPYSVSFFGSYPSVILKYEYTYALGLQLSTTTTLSDAFASKRTTVAIPNVSKGSDLRCTASSEHSNIHPVEDSNTIWTIEDPVITTETLSEYSFDNVYAATDRAKVTKGNFYLTTSEIPLNVDLQIGTHLKLTGDDTGNIVYSTIRNVYTSGALTYVILEDLVDLDTTMKLEVSIVTSISSLSGYNYPKAMEVGLGRVFMTPLTESNTVYYSQIYTEDAVKSHKFHIEANPFNPTDSDLVASDGGFFTVSGATFIVGLMESSGALIIFAENGIWEAVGGEGIFKPTDFVVRKLTDKGCISQSSIERMEGGIVYVSNDGVNIVTKDDKTGLTSVVNSLTDNKINEYFKYLSVDNKSVMASTYNPIEKELYILYNEDTEQAPMIAAGTPQHYRSILIFKLKLGAWYKWSLSEDIDGDKLSMSCIWMSQVNQPLVYLTKYTGTAIQNTYGKLLTTQVYDFEGTVDQEYNTPSFSSAHQTYSDIMRGKLANYIKVFYKSLQDLGTDAHGIDMLKGGCNLRVSLDTADSPETIIDEFGQPKTTNVGYGIPYAVYPAKKPGYSHVMYKHKVLGRGNLLQFHFSAETDQRFFKAVSTCTGESPILDTANTYWEEIAEDDLVSELEWDVATAYSVHATCKVTHPNHFHITGWSCDLIPTESITSS